MLSQKQYLQNTGKLKKRKNTNLTILAVKKNTTRTHFEELIERMQTKKGGIHTLKTDLFNNAKIFLLFTPCSSK